MVASWRSKKRKEQNLLAAVEERLSTMQVVRFWVIGSMNEAALAGIEAEQSGRAHNANLSGIATRRCLIA